MTVKNLIRLVVILVLIFLPLAVWWCCLRSPPFPGQLVIATGRADGRYAAISQALAERMETELKVPVKLLPTNGSLDNLHHLQRGTADFALYQPGTREALDEHEDAAKVAFVANVYSQPAHFIVRRGAGITGPADLKGKRHRVSLGLSNSGDLAMSLALLDHFNLDPKSDIDAKIGLDYVEIERLFQAGELDAAFITVGVQGDVFRRIAEIEACQFLAISNVDALLRNNLYVSPYTVPRGLYRFDPPVPEEDVPTVAATAQLLTRTDLPRRLIEDVTELVHDEEFIKENRLWELSAGGREFALAKPEFPLHPGARAYYYPELRPLLDPGFVESWEGMISLAC
jgi:TRAP transporter TAXI family solute receptor